MKLISNHMKDRGIIIIDKEKNLIEKSLLLFGVIFAICFMIYVCISQKIVIYTYIILMFMIVLLLTIDSLMLKKKLTENYTIDILILSMIMVAFGGREVFYYTVFLTLILIGIRLCIAKVRTNKEQMQDKEIQLPIGFYMTICNICLIIISNMILLI